MVILVKDVVLVVGLLVIINRPHDIRSTWNIKLPKMAAFLYLYQTRTA